jgi:phosphatidylglycerophosphatase A
MPKSDKLALLLASGFGCGYVPWAPGTAGAAAALLPAWVLERYTTCGKWSLALLALLAAPLAVWSSQVAAARLGRKDPGFVVIDEVLGQWVALLGANLGHPVSWLAAFGLFRLFDIWKPPPCRRLERLAGGWGIVADDVAAGCYAALVLWGAGCFNLY